MNAVNELGAIGARGAELARYRVSGGERVLMGWRTPGGIEVTDRPTEGRARGYVVDRGFGCFEQLRAFVADYVDQANRADECPMSAGRLGELVEDSDADSLSALVSAL